MGIKKCSECLEMIIDGVLPTYARSMFGEEYFGNLPTPWVKTTRSTCDPRYVLGEYGGFHDSDDENNHNKLISLS